MAQWSKNAITVLEARYLAKDKKGNSIETPDGLLHRVAHAVAQAEKEDVRQKWEDEFYGIMDSLDFLPNSPTLMNAGRNLGQLLACFVLPVGDSIEHIFEMAKQTAIIHKSGGGTGFNFSALRPAGALVQSTNGTASGPCSFLKIFDAVTDVVKQGGVRRGANLGVLNCTHPDVWEFIHLKEDTNRFKNFNLSVAFNGHFFEDVKNDRKVQLHFRGQPYREEVPAAKIFEAVCQGAWQTGEPGVLFLDTINNANPTPWLGRIFACNPCLTANTQIALADGRGMLPIKQLVDEGKDVPVYCRNSNGKIAIRMMRNPRKSGNGVPIIRIELDNGQSLRVTKNHKFVLSDGRAVEGKDLVPGDGLFIMTKKESTIGNILFGENNRAQMYHWLKFGNSEKWLAEHRVIAGFYHGYLSDDAVIHHIDHNGRNNVIDNLEVMTKEAHDKLHRDRMLGDGNPMRRFPEKNWRNNPIKQQEIREKYHIGKKRPQQARENIAAAVRKAYAEHPEIKDLISQKTKEGMGQHRENFENFLKSRAKKKLLECQSKTDLQCFLDGNSVKVLKFCEECEDAFVVSWERRETAYCRIQCWNQKLGRMKRRKSASEPIYANHKVVSVIDDGMEDVYTGTVDDFHNYFIGGFAEKDGESDCLVFVNTLQCGESPLLAWEACDLGSINLSHFISGHSFDFQRLQQTTRVAMRFLDDITDVSKFPRMQIERMSKKTRKTGLGVMGWADALGMLKIEYDSQEALELADKVMGTIHGASINESERLCVEKGTSVPQLKRRNATVNTCAPTGSLSLLADCSSGIEPQFAEDYTKTVINGTKLGLGRSYGMKTALQIAPKDHVLMQAAFQRHTDNAISKTINLPSNATVEDVSEAILLAYDLGCKGVTLYRQGSRLEAPLQENQISDCQGDKCLI